VTKWECRPYRRCLSPKHRFGFRVSTQLDPLDAIIFLALVYEIGPDIETARVPSPNDVVFSYRFLPDSSGAMFDHNYSYNRFQKHTQSILASGGHSHVVVADIADFYPRLYSHPLENALKTCTKKSTHVTSVHRLLSKLNYSVSYGVPVGPAPSRLLAELAINDVDQALLSEGRRYCRYSDDYRLFCKSEREAYEALAFLANTLFETHGLTLQQHKTEIIGVEAFKQKYISFGAADGSQPLSERFAEILTRRGLGLYDEIDYSGLDASGRKEIDDLNLDAILAEQLAKDSIDISVTRTVLNIRTQIKSHKSLDSVVDGLPKLYTVLKDALGYIHSFEGDTARQAAIGAKMLEMLANSLIGHLEFHRCWVLSTFADDRQWDNENRFIALYNQFTDEFSRRELILAIGRAGQGHWFKSRKRNVHNFFRPWEKRAFIAAASCLPGDEHKHWVASIEGRLDILERTVARWARQFKFV
jgi:hypothetical protein